MIIGNQVLYSLIKMNKNMNVANNGPVLHRKSSKIKYPIFYANDCNGYMGFYLRKAGIYERYEEQRIKYFQLEVNGEIWVLSNDYDTFFMELKLKFPEESAELEEIKEMIEQTGQEWFDFITNDMKMSQFPQLKRNIQYSPYNFMQIVQEKLKNKTLNAIFYFLQPHSGEISFNIMAGYLYKQFFDLHKIKHFWDDIYSLNDIEQDIATDNNAAIMFVDHVEKEVSENYFRYFSMIIEIDNSKNDHLLLTSILYEENPLHTIIWPLHYCLDNEKKMYKVDVAIENRSFDFAQIQKVVEEKLKSIYNSYAIIDIVKPQDYEKIYGFKDGTGLRWALSAKHSNMLHRNFMNDRDYSYWGYAWFSSTILFQSRL